VQNTLHSKGQSWTTILKS